MRVVKCSASAINTYRHCPFSYFLSYILGMETKTGKAALQGTIVHRVLEIMAGRTKRGKSEIDPMVLLHHVWDKLVDKSPGIEIRKVTTRTDPATGNKKEAADFKKCRVALETVLGDPFYNPYSLKIVDVERWFALEMPDEEWRCCDKDGELHQFAVRGFIDLVHEIDQDTIEVVDWKTGERKDFYTREEIEVRSLMRSVQPRLYHLAACELYPQYENIILTFYYANSGGPVTITLSRDDLATTIAFLYKFFVTVRNDTLVMRNRSWKCKMCSFERSRACDRVWSDLHTFGEEYVASRYAELDFDQQVEITSNV